MPPSWKAGVEAQMKRNSSDHDYDDVDDQLAEETLSFFHPFILENIPVLCGSSSQQYVGWDTR